MLDFYLGGTATIAKDCFTGVVRTAQSFFNECGIEVREEVKTVNYVNYEV